MLENKAQDIQNQAPTTTTTKKSEKQHITIGEAILATMSPEEVANLGSKSGTLHFQHLLGLQSKKADRVGKNRQSYDSFRAVGVTLVSDEPISVPVIDVLKDKKTGINPETDITYRDVEAGVPFDLTYYEFMYLIIRDEYAGFCSREGDPKGVYFSAKMNAYLKNQAEAPTPTINFTQEGSPKENMIAIDRKEADGRWVIKDEYAEKFGALLKRRTPNRTSESKQNIPTPTVTAVALSKILGVRK